MSLRLSSCADEDRRIIYLPTLHVLKTQVLRGTGFVRPVLDVRSVVSCFKTRPPFDVVDTCIAILLVSI